MENLINLAKSIRKELIRLVKIYNEKAFIHNNNSDKNLFTESYRNMMTSKDELRCSIYNLSYSLIKEYNTPSSIYHSSDFIYCNLIKMLDNSILIDLSSFLLCYDQKANQLFKDLHLI